MDLVESQTSVVAIKINTWDDVVLGSTFGVYLWKMNFRRFFGCCHGSKFCGHNKVLNKSNDSEVIRLRLR